MTNIEIPLQNEKSKTYRWFERMPAVMSWSILALPFILSQINATLTAIVIIAYFIMWFVRAIGLSFRAIQGYRTMKKHMVLPWKRLLEDVENREFTLKKLKWHRKNINLLSRYPELIKPSEVLHAVIIAVYNESKDIVEPTVKAVLNSNYDSKKIALVIAYEERGGEEVEKLCNELIKEYGSSFLLARAIKHPKDLENEVIGKGGNITFAGKLLENDLKKRNINSSRVIVTTLDSDNRPHKNYFSALTYTYCLSVEPKHISYQPIPMFTNNIWDAPAPMRVIATGNSFWMIVQALRPHMLRNFSSHAQSMEALIDTDFWSVRTIVEDGHQFWRTYFRYDGKHDVYPIYLPIYQDAVLAEGYKRTLKAQFIQIRRWAWGASDIPFVIHKGLFEKNKVPGWNLTTKIFRLVEGHISWATAPIILLFSAFIPILFNPDDLAANQLPNVASIIMRVGTLGIVVTLFLGLLTLPPRPERYKRRRRAYMIIQWVILPLTSVAYSASAALYSQSRLFLGKYLDKFDVTEKHFKKD